MYLNAVGHFHPENVITNSFLEELAIGTSDEWILDRVGIRTRHTVLPLEYIHQTKNGDASQAARVAAYSNAETGRRAAQLALDRAKLLPSQIGMVIAGGCSPEESIPAEACRIADALGIQAPAFDINAACSSFCAQAHLLASMRPEKLPDHVLLVNVENSTRIVDYSDRSSCVLWGDGTSAAIFSPRHPGPFRITETLLRGDPSGADKIRIPRYGHFAQEGSAVHAFAIRRATELAYELKRTYLERHPHARPERFGFIGHQANLRMLEAVSRRCEILPERHHFNIDRRGNCGASGAPTVLSENWENPELGDALAVAVVGAGLTWSGLLLERV